MRQAFLEAGKVRNTHALRGEVKFECWLDGEKPLQGIRSLFPAPKEENALEVISCRRQGDVFLVQFKGIDSVEKATLLKGKTLYVSRDEADPKGDKVYFADLLGLPLIEEASGTVYGTIVQVTSRGAGELFLIKLSDGKEAYFPAVPSFIAKMDPENGVFVHAPEGIFD